MADHLPVAHPPPVGTNPSSNGSQNSEDEKRPDAGVFSLSARLASYVFFKGDEDVEYELTLGTSDGCTWFISCITTPGMGRKHFTLRMKRTKGVWTATLVDTSGKGLGTKIHYFEDGERRFDLCHNNTGKNEAMTVRPGSLIQVMTPSGTWRDLRFLVHLNGQRPAIDTWIPSMLYTLGNSRRFQEDAQLRRGLAPHCDFYGLETKPRRTTIKTIEKGDLLTRYGAQAPERLAREVEAFAGPSQLDCPNVIRVMECFETTDEMHIVIEATDFTLDGKMSGKRDGWESEDDEGGVKEEEAERAERKRKERKRREEEKEEKRRRERERERERKRVDDDADEDEDEDEDGTVPHSEEEGKLMAVQVATGIGALHDDLGFAHRGLKPLRIEIEEVPGEEEMLIYKVAGMELGKLEDDGPQFQTQVTASAYTSPRNFSPPYNYGVDWYSLGVMTFQFVTGRLPFEDGDEDLPAGTPDWIWSRSPDVMSAKIVELQTKQRLSQDFVNFVRRLTQTDGNESAITTAEVLQHPWLAGIENPAFGERYTSLRTHKW